MKKYLHVVADCNDGDLLERVKEIDDETLLLVTPLIHAIKEITSNREIDFNWPNLEWESESIYNLYEEFPKEVINKFSRFVPYGEHGVHSIYKINLLEVTYKKEFL